MKKIKLLLIVDNRLLREVLISRLYGQNDIQIIAGLGSNETNVSKVQKLKPDIIILDLGMGSRNRLTVVKDIKKDFPNAKIIILDIALVKEDINQLVKSGVSGFILKDASFDDSLMTIRKVAAGTDVIPSDLDEPLYSRIIEYALKDGKLNLEELTLITKRESEVIYHIGNGLNNKDIAMRLNVSNFTVKSHVNNIMNKLELHTRLEVANYSYTNNKL